MERPDLLVVESIVSQPTAPFHEYHVKEAIHGWLKDCEHVTLESDHFGNLIARYQNGDRTPRWAFGAHMDHPGWVKRPADAPDLPEDQRYRLRDGYQFLGGVPAEYFDAQPPLEEFGEFAMWDLPACELDEKGRIRGRACDDLVGCAAIVATLRSLEERGATGSCYAIFTRAEEVGFVGACELARAWPLPRHVVFTSIETSVATGRTAMGDGPICRVGDRMSIFDSAATAAMLAAAKSRELPVQRALLDLGSCEATALQSYGLKTAGISVPLGNYHNCATDNRIGAEFVSREDLDTLIALMMALVEEFPPDDDSPAQDLRESFDDRIDRYRVFASASAPRFAPESSCATP